MSLIALQRVGLILSSIEKNGGEIERGMRDLVGLFEEGIKAVDLEAQTVISQQILIRRILNSIKTPTIGLLVAWDESMRRWKELNSIVFSRNSDGTSGIGGSAGGEGECFEGIGGGSPEDQCKAWANLSSFISATSGAIIPAKENMRLDSLIEINLNYFPIRYFKGLENRGRGIERVIQELVDLLVSDSIKIRDVVKNCLGNDLNETQFPLFFKHLKSIVGHFFDNEKGVPVTEEASTVFIDMTISVLRLMFDRVQLPLTKSANSSIDSLLLSFTIYIQRLSLISLQAFRLKIRLCSLIQCVFNLCLSSNDNSGSNRQESIFRNKLVEYLISWSSTSGSTTVKLEEATGSNNGAADRLPRDLDSACLKALVPLLDNLIVHRTDDKLIDSEITDERIFSRYFNFFSLNLKKQSETTIHHSNQLKSKSKPQESQLDRHWNVKNSTESRESATKALGNLISSNSSIAFRYLGGMGLEGNEIVRGAYLDTLIQVVDKGTRLDLLPRVPVDDTFEKLVALIRQPDLKLAMALSEVCSAGHFEDSTEIFLKIFDTPKSVAKFLKAVIEMEVSVTDHESTLFRGNSFATRILTSYARAKGYHYLRNTLKDLLLTLCMKPHEFSVDFDPHKQTSTDDAASKNLEQVTEAFLVCISQSVDQIPSCIREICFHIGEVVGARFPESVFTAIGGFIFLRFINPAIVSPENIDLDLPTENRDIRRGLVMITKVLQALANNVRFGAKEPGMRKLNDFMDVNIFGMTRFLQAISHYESIDNSVEPIRSSNSAQPLEETEKSYLHQFLCDNIEKLSLEILEGKHSENEDVNLATSTWDNVSQLISDLGTPPESACRLAAAGWEISPEQSYKDFMIENEFRVTPDSKSWSDIFFETSGNKSGNTTFSVILRRIKADTIDLESLLHYVFQELAKVSGPFEILVDCTRFSKENEVPIQFLLQLTTLLPASSVSNFIRMIIYSPNSSFKRYLRELNRFISFEKMDSRKVITFSTPEELESVFLNSEITLSRTTMSMSRESRITFQDITEHHDVKVEDPVILKVGSQTLVVSTAKKQDLFGSDVKATLDDIIELSEIETIKKITIGKEGDGINIQVAGEAARIFLVTRRDELFLTLNNAREALSQPKILTKDSSLLTQDVSAVLINTVLFNLCSNQASIRSSAFELLSSLARSQNLVGFEDLANSKGISVPSGHLSFLSNVSERLASALTSDSLAVVGQFAIALGKASANEAALYIYLIRPWLHNLFSLSNTAREDREGVTIKLRRLIKQLMQISIRQPAIHMVMITRIWPAVGKIDFFIPLVLDEAVTLVSALEPGVETEITERISEVLLALSSSGPMLRGKLLARLRQVIARTALNPVENLSHSIHWSEITALLRLDLPLSFNAHLTAQLFLPDIFQISISLVATGTLAVRRIIKNLVVNTVHSLLREGAQYQDALITLLSTLNGAQASELFDFPTVDENREAWDLAEAGDLLVEILVEVMEVGSPSLDTSNMWKNRWASLASATCFQHNPPLQARAFVVLGALSSDDTDPDLFFQMLAQLRSCIYRSESDDDLLTVVVLKCITRQIPGLSSDSSFFSTAFFSGLSILQSASPEISPHAIALLQAVIERLRERGFFIDRSVDDVIFELQDLEDTDLPINDDLMRFASDWISACVEFSVDQKNLENGD